MAPANASAPPSSHTHRIADGLPAICATMIGTKKMPPPMTLEMTMAAASMGPSRRSMADDEAGGAAARGARDTSGLLSQQLPRHRDALQLDPLRRALFGEDRHFDVLALAVLEHLRARLRRIAGVAPLRSHGDGLGPSRVERHALHVDVVGMIRRAGKEEAHVERHRRQLHIRILLELEGDARNELVLPRLHAGVEIAG